MGVCNCSMYCCTLLYVHSRIAIILMGKRELIALLNLSSWCLVMVERLFLAVLRGCLQFVIVVFPDHAHLLFLEFLYVGLTGGWTGSSESTLVKKPHCWKSHVTHCSIIRIYSVRRDTQLLYLTKKTRRSIILNLGSIKGSMTY